MNMINTNSFSHWIAWPLETFSLFINGSPGCACCCPGTNPKQVCFLLRCALVAMAAPDKIMTEVVFLLSFLSPSLVAFSPCILLRAFPLPSGGSPQSAWPVLCSGKHLHPVRIKVF